MSSPKPVALTTASTGAYAGTYTPQPLEVVGGVDANLLSPATLDTAVTTIVQDAATPSALNTAVRNLVARDSGFALYDDAQYTVLSPLQLLADTNTLLDNDALDVGTDETHLPSDLASMYNATTSAILGFAGDAYALTIFYTVKPTSAGTTYIEQWIEQGGTVGQEYRRPFSFPKGTGVERVVTTSTAVNINVDWAANGGKVYLRANGPCDVYNIHYHIFRLHKAH